MMKIIGSLHENGDGTGTVRLEDVFSTDVDDLWEACTTPSRLARWVGNFSGDLSVGGRFDAHFTSGWEGTGTIEICDPPHRLRVVTTETGGVGDCVLEATLTAQGSTTLLVIEERGLPVDQLPAYGAGWQIHVEDLAAHLAGRPRNHLADRWGELINPYRQLPVL